MEWLWLYTAVSYNAAVWLYLTGKLVYLAGTTPEQATPHDIGFTRGLCVGAPLSLPVYALYVLCGVFFSLFRPK